jgi:hypothetical protein
MSRKKKNKHIDLDKKEEVIMTQKLEVIAETELVPEKFDMEATQAEIEQVSNELQEARLELERTRREIIENKQALQASARREISPEEKIISDKHVSMNNEKLAKVKAFEDQKAFDKVLVTGKFMNLRNPGQPVKLPYIKYIEDPVKWYPFQHGKIYTIPRGFADQINEHYYTPTFIQKEGGIDSQDGDSLSQIADVDKSAKRYAFVPVGF